VVDSIPLILVKIIEAHYRNVMLLQQFLPAIREILGEFSIFRQNSARAHRTLEVTDYLPVTSSDVDRVLKFFQRRQ